MASGVYPRGVPLVTVDVKINSGAVNAGLDRMFRVYAEAKAEKVATRAKILAPYKTRKLRASIRSGVSGGWPKTYGWVRANSDGTAPYARIVSGGSRPHTIRPRRKKVLRFPTSDGIVFTRRVNHPGTKPNSYLQRALAGEFKT